jgi:ABC-2 type transport system ATP-binding protein
MHVEDMHDRRSLRMLLIRFGEGGFSAPPSALALIERERDGPTALFEHRGELGPLLNWLASAPIEDIAIGTEDLRSLYDRFHGPNAPDEDDAP